MTILSFDIATRSGYAVGSTNFGLDDSGSFSCKSLINTATTMAMLMDLWKPDIIVTAKPTRFYDAIRKQSEITGVLLYLAEKRGIKVRKNLVDSQCKLAVIGRGNATKKDICEKYKTEDEDAADAIMFFDYICLTM